MHTTYAIEISSLSTPGSSKPLTATLLNQTVFLLQRTSDPTGDRREVSPSSATGRPVLACDAFEGGEAQHEKETRSEEQTS